MTKQSECGYSLTEVLIVLTLMGFLSSISMPAVTNLLPNASIQAAERQVASDVKSLRRKAMFESQNISVVFEVDSAIYNVTQGTKLTQYELPGRAIFKTISGKDAEISIQANGALDGDGVEIIVGRRSVSLTVDPLLDRIVVK